MSKLPEWAKQEAADGYGNVTCLTCGKAQSPHFSACIYCCKHDILSLHEEWRGADDGGGWELEADCEICGKNHCFDNDTLIRDYQLTRKPT